MASDAQQDRHIMSQTTLERRGFPVPMRWPHAGSDLSRPDLRGRRAVRPLIRFKRLLRCLYTLPIPLRGLSRPHRVAVAPTLQLGAEHQIPIALAAHAGAQTSRDFVPWRFLDAGRRGRGGVRHAGVQKPAQLRSLPGATHWVRATFKRPPLRCFISICPSLQCSVRAQPAGRGIAPCRAGSIRDR